MGRSSRYRYREYRGRRGGDGGRFLRVLVILLAVLLAAALIFTLFLGKYVEYTDGGVRLSFSWPWEKEGAEPSLPPVPSSPLVVVTPEPTPTPTPEAAPTVSEEPVFLPVAVEVTAAHLADGTAAHRVKEAGGNCLVVEMKNEYGRINWPSRVKNTIGLPTGVAEAAAKAVKDLDAAGELYLVARVNCFRDQTLSNAGRGGPLLTGGGKIWYDSDGLRWVSPASEDVRTYLTALFVELAELGFDEILLECAGYPYYGETHALATDGLRPEVPAQPVEAFWRQLREELAARNVRLSLLVTEAMITGADACSGIDAGLLARYADRVWVPLSAEGTDYAALLFDAGMDRAAERLVILGAAEGGRAVMEAPAG